MHKQFRGEPVIPRKWRDRTSGAGGKQETSRTADVSVNVVACETAYFLLGIMGNAAGSGQAPNNNRFAPIPSFSIMVRQLQEMRKDRAGSRLAHLPAELFTMVCF